MLPLEDLQGLVALRGHRNRPLHRKGQRIASEDDGRYGFSLLEPRRLLKVKRQVLTSAGLGHGSLSFRHSPAAASATPAGPPPPSSSLLFRSFDAALFGSLLAPFLTQPAMAALAATSRCLAPSCSWLLDMPSYSGLRAFLLGSDTRVELAAPCCCLDRAGQYLSSRPEAWEGLGCLDVGYEVVGRSRTTRGRCARHTAQHTGVVDSERQKGHLIGKAVVGAVPLADAMSPHRFTTTQHPGTPLVSFRNLPL